MLKIINLKSKKTPINEHKPMNSKLFFENLCTDESVKEKESLKPDQTKSNSSEKNDFDTESWDSL